MHGGEIASRIEALIGEMTLAEKLGQLSMIAASLVQTGPPGPHNPVTMVREGRVGGILNLWGYEEVREAQRVALEETRLKIPLYIAADVVYGQRTIVPIPLGESCAFDRALWERTARLAADEASRDGIHIALAPMIDVTRDPRWGRISECAGEDPFVTAEFARAKVRGFQNSPIERRLAAVAKHFAAYGAVKAGRDYAEVDVSPRALHEIYLPPFRAAVEEGVAGVMAAFVDVAGLAMTANRQLLRGLLRDTWGFDGVIMSDYNSIAELIVHGVAEDRVEAAALALNAGIDIDMMSNVYEEGLPPALKRGLVTMDDIDAAVRRVLRLKCDLGLFENPLRGIEKQAPLPDLAPERRATAREAARRSIVLIKNEGELLPLRPADYAGKRVALLGPLSGAWDNELGPWCIADDVKDSIFALQGIGEALPASEILHAAGCQIAAAVDAAEIAAAVELAQASEAVILCLGEDRRFCGEASSRTAPGPFACQLELARAIIATGKPLVLAIATSRPWILPDWLVDGAAAILLAHFAGAEGGRALGDVIAGAYNPSARLAISWPWNVGQIPVHYGMRKSGRPHDPENHYTTRFLDAPITPRWAFGEGLSYTKYEMANLRADRSVIGPDESARIEIDVGNAGPCAGEAIVFLFVNDPVAQVTRPVLELKDFAKIFLAPGQSGTVSFALRAEQLTYPGVDLEPRLDNGRIHVYAGASSRPHDLSSLTIEVRGVV